MLATARLMDDPNWQRLPMLTLHYGVHCHCWIIFSHHLHWVIPLLASARCEYSLIYRDGIANTLCRFHCCKCHSCDVFHVSVRVYPREFWWLRGNGASRLRIQFFPFYRRVFMFLYILLKPLESRPQPPVVNLFQRARVSWCLVVIFRNHQLCNVVLNLSASDFHDTADRKQRRNCLENCRFLTSYSAAHQDIYHWNECHDEIAPVSSWRDTVSLSSPHCRSRMIDLSQTGYGTITT